MNENIRPRYWRYLTVSFGLFGMLLAGFNFLSAIGARRVEEVFHIFGKVIIITICFYSPIFHPWYFLLPLPFLIAGDKKSWMIWLAVVPAIACLHEIKFVIPRGDSLYALAEGLVYPMLLSFFLFFRKHFIMEPFELLKPVFYSLRK